MSFNEAPAKHGGELLCHPGNTKEIYMASMRPPRNTGGNGSKVSPGCMSSCRFNEAPAKHGGERRGLMEIVEQVWLQ